MKIHGIEIEDGYLLVVQTKDEVHNMTVVSSRRNAGELGCVTPDKHYWPVHKFNENGVFLDSQILAIYGRTYNCFLLDNSTEERELLWKAEEKPKKMTVAEICKELGYYVEIVKEAQE